MYTIYFSVYKQSVNNPKIIYTDSNSYNDQVFKRNNIFPVLNNLKFRPRIFSSLFFPVKKKCTFNAVSETIRNIFTFFLLEFYRKHGNNTG